MRKVEVQELRYYRYVILFNGQIKNEKAIIKISDLSELKLINKGRMHLFDEEILPVLPAIEYCLHMPRTELDTYDTDTEILDRAYDVSHDIVIMPERFIFGIHLLHDPSCTSGSCFPSHNVSFPLAFQNCTFGSFSKNLRYTTILRCTCLSS